MSKAFVERLARGVDDVGRCIEIGFPNLEVNNVASLRLQRSRLDQNFKSGLRAEARSPLCEAKIAGLSHDGEIKQFPEVLSTLNHRLSTFRDLWLTRRIAN